MYTLQKAKEDIDAVAKHATDIAVHAIAVADDVDAKLERFKTEILSAIEEKFAGLERTIRGDGEPVETTAISDLGAKVSLLARAAHPPAATDADHAGHDTHHADENSPDDGHRADDGHRHDETPQQDHGWNHDQHSEHHHHG